MTTQQIADKVTSLLRQGQFDAVYEDYFDTENVRHLEPQSPFFPDLKGVKALREKDAQMQANIASIDGMEVGHPIIAKSHFALPYKMAITLKDGNKMEMDEIIVYEVKNGKIILEQFFY